MSDTQPEPPATYVDYDDAWQTSDSNIITTSSASHFSVFGWTMVMAGGGLGGGGFLMDISGGALSGYGDIANLDAMAIRQLIVSVGVGLFVSGIICLATASILGAIQQLASANHHQG